MSFEEMVPTEEDLKLLLRLLIKQDELGNLDKCDDHMAPDGTCNICTALQRLNSLINLMEQEDAWIATK